MLLLDAIPIICRCFDTAMLLRGAAGGASHGPSGPPPSAGGAIGGRARHLNRALRGRVDVEDLPLRGQVRT